MCQVDYGDDYATVWSETWVKRSRKPHTCSTCGSVIPVGSRYLNHFSVCDGDAATEAQCEACEAIAARFAAEHKVGKPFPSSLPDYLDNCVDYGDEDSKRWRAAVEEISDRRAAAFAARRGP